MRIGFAQFAPKRGDLAHNRRRLIATIKSSEADLLVFPELCTTGYLFRDKDHVFSLAENIPEGETSVALQRSAVENGCAVVAGIAERGNDNVYNSSILALPTGELKTYRKVHLFSEERRYFSAGRELPVFELEDIKIGIVICFDWAYPEAIRTLALKGADIVCHPSNLVLPFGQKAMVTRSIENRVFTVTANRWGTEGSGRNELAFSGKSQIVDPKGNVLASAKGDEDRVCIVSIDPLEARDKHITPQDELFTSRMPEAYRLQ